MKIRKKVKEGTNELTSTEFPLELSKVEDKYSLVSKLALALLTAHNSSSSAERDISQMVGGTHFIKLISYFNSLIFFSLEA